MVKPALLRRAEVEGDLLDGGGDEEQVGLYLTGQEGAAQVLVDDGLDAVEVAAASSATTGIPPPPTATTMTPASINVLIGAELDDPERAR